MHDLVAMTWGYTEPYQTNCSW